MNGQLKVVIDGLVYQSQTFGGISRLFTEILPRMCDLDSTLHITLFTQGGLRQNLPRHHRITHLPTPDPERFMRPRLIFKPFTPLLRRFIRKLYIPTDGDSIWHSTYYTIPKKWTGYLVVTVHDMIFELFPQFYSGPSFDLFRQRKRLSAQQADAVICVSDTTRRDVLRLYGLDANRVYVVPNACSEVFRNLDRAELSGIGQIEQPFLLYVGSRARYKNFELLAKVYSLWPRRKEVALVLVGGKPFSESEQRLMEELAIAKQVKLLRDIDDETLCCLYNCALAFVYPSLYEGFGMPLLEAMACGCPIIASRVPSTIEVAGDCPIYFNPAEQDELLNALDVVLSGGRNTERVQAGLERVKSYSWDKTAAQTLEVYRGI